MRERPVPVRYLFVGTGVLGAIFLGRAFSEDLPGEGAARTPPRPSAVGIVAEVPEVPGEISVRSLLREMVDPTAIARLPEPPYVARAATSYDRRSVTPTDPEGWFANDDWASETRPNYVRVEERAGRREIVLMDARGPGALVRIWSASPAGTVRFYFDGETKPEIELPFELLLRGRGPIPEPFAYVAAKGFNAYFPLPCRTGLKVTIDALVGKNPWQEGTFERIYYQLAYRSYPDAVAGRVRTYRQAELAAMLRSAEATTRVFREPWRSYEATEKTRTVPLVRDGDELHAV
ncbi:MAG TPA: hypothetical protein VF103_04200, partial [Polyangiaceae bacterium]